MKIWTNGRLTTPDLLFETARHVWRFARGGREVVSVLPKIVIL
jgi:hypothetical protein